MVGWRSISGCLLIAVLFASGIKATVAQELSPFDESEERQRQFEPPPDLPEGLIGVVRPRTGVRSLDRIERIRDVFQAVQACWQPPTGSGFSGQEITLRMSFKRTGEVLGTPRITYYKPGTDPGQRDAFTRAVRATFERCTPLPFSDSFGAAVAGRPFVFRFVDARPL